MSKSKGWILLYRQIMDSTIWDDGTPFDRAHAWIDLIMLANFAEETRIISGQTVTIHRGQAFVSDKYLMDRWHWSRNRVRRFIRDIQNLGMGTAVRTGVGTWINIENYEKFQNSRTGVDTGDGTGKGTTVDTSRGTSGGTQNKKGERRLKNINNARTREREITSHVDDLSMEELELRLLQSN